jgi:CHAT domain-containing protein
VQTIADVPDFDTARAHRLYLAFLAPVAEVWKGAASLIVIPHGALTRLPVALLPTDAMPTAAMDRLLAFDRYRRVPWLVRSHAVAQVPSGTALLALRTAAPAGAAAREFVGFGDPVFVRAAQAPATPEDIALQVRSVRFRNLQVERVAASVGGIPSVTVRNSSRLAQLPALPDTRDEIREIATVLSADPEQDVFVGERASEREAKSGRLNDRRVVAFATHGLMAGQLDGLTQPALALSAPPADDPNDDGLLTMQEILGLHLNAEWVVLSACNTAAGRESQSEALSGLGRAFFYAGARSLLVTNWAVETTSARALTTRLFALQRERPELRRAQALQATMNALIDGPGRVHPRTGRSEFSYAHPVFWAPFALVGD